jgi:TonB family protein
MGCHDGNNILLPSWFFYGETTRNMKTMWVILSARRPFILSISIHMLIFSIPISMGIKPQIYDMELFVSIEDLRMSPESVRTQMETKKPQPEPVKEIIQPIEAFPKIQKPEMVESVKEVKKEPTEEVKVEQIEGELNSPPAIESRETISIPLVPNITEGNTDIPTKDRPAEASINVVEQPIKSRNSTGGETSNLIETRFGESIAPTFLHREMPVYPMMARKLGREGRVILKLTIDENGTLLDVEVIKRADYGFTEAAIEAVKKSTFLPAKKDGKPIVSQALLPIKFRLEKN